MNPFEIKNLSRKKSLVRPERSRSIKRGASIVIRRPTVKALLRSDTVQRTALAVPSDKSEKKITCWISMSRILTFYVPFSLLSTCTKLKERHVQQAFREKLALCTIILFIMACVAFLTFGFRKTLCIIPQSIIPYDQLNQNSAIAVGGNTYSLDQSFSHPTSPIPNNIILGNDLTFMFPFYSSSACAAFTNQYPIPCTASGVDPKSNHCHTSSASNKALNSLSQLGQVYIPWNSIQSSINIAGTQKTIVVYNGMVLDVTKYSGNSSFLGSSIYNLVSNNLGTDITYLILANKLKAQADCLSTVFAIAYVDTESAGCFVSDIVLYISLAFIGGVVLTRFLIALFFGFFIGWRLGDPDGEMLKLINSGVSLSSLQPVKELPKTNKKHRNQKNRNGSSRKGIAQNNSRSEKIAYDIAFMDLNNPAFDDPNDTLMHTLVMVPCYSEGADSMRTTIESVVDSDFPATHKVIVVVADGIVQGSGNDKPTHEFVIDLMDIDYRFSKEDPKNGGIPEAYSYVAIADGNKRKNYARVYAGWFKSNETETCDDVSENASSNDTIDMTGTAYTLQERRKGRVPMLLVVKVGNEEERVPGYKKPGNRGKRDSQVVLMNFLAKVMFDDRMTELEFDLFYKLWTISGVIPEKYEAVMMVDADTKLFKEALRHLIAAMSKDPDVIGLCGETKIGNEWQSWVTMIQVFEYYISHNLAKAFESVFGVVTCLPGCFSLYRISAPKGPGLCVPILANPDIVEEYAENVVDTLHKKNLLLLGEDRYLSTLLLRSFPKRKMQYVPNAICETIVPDKFTVLLSQRRRWINSTIHNLLELILVRDLCGIFCFSMQFVIFMELIGTVVLPAAISFTTYVIVISVTAPNPPIVTLVLLAVILGLPGLLTVLISGNVKYLFWMIIYLIALPVWNFVLPVYAFWHFDDFSWGETRKTLSDSKGDDHGRREGEFDGTGIHMKCWADWMLERRKQIENQTSSNNRIPTIPTTFPPPALLPPIPPVDPSRPSKQINLQRSLMVNPNPYVNHPLSNTMRPVRMGYHPSQPTMNSVPMQTRYNVPLQLRPQQLNRPVNYNYNGSFAPSPRPHPPLSQRSFSNESESSK